MIVERVATDHQLPFVRSGELSSSLPSHYQGCAQLRQSVGGSEIVHHAATAPFSLRSPASTPALAVWYRFHRRNPARDPHCPLEIQRPNPPACNEQIDRPWESRRHPALAIADAAIPRLQTARTTRQAADLLFQCSVLPCSWQHHRSRLRSRTHSRCTTSLAATAGGPLRFAPENASDRPPLGTPLSSKSRMPGDVRARRVPCPKIARSARRVETSGSLARYRPAECRVPATSEKSPRASSNIRNLLPARIVAPPRSSGPRPAPPASAPRLARRTDCCPVRSAHLRLASASSAASKRLSRAPPASACRRLRHRDAHPPASAAPWFAGAAISASARLRRFPAAGVRSNDRRDYRPRLFRPSAQRQALRLKLPAVPAASQSRDGCAEIQTTSSALMQT